MASWLESMTKEEFLDALKSQGGRVGQAVSNGTGAVVGASLDLGGKVLTGTASFQDITSAFSSVAGTVLPFGDTIKKVLDMASHGLIEANNIVNESARTSGIGFNNNLGQMAESVLGARMSIDKNLVDYFKRAAPTISGFGGNMAQTGQTLLELDAQVQESKIGQELKKAGMSAQELNDITLVYSGGLTNINRLNKVQQADLAASAAAFGKELDLNARLFGKSREEQQKDIEAVKKRADVLAGLSQLDFKARQNFSDVLSVSQGQGKALVDSISEYYIKGVTTGTNASTMNLLGDAAPQIMKTIDAIKATQDEAEKVRLKDQLRQQLDAANLEMMSKGFANAAVNSKSVVGDTARSLIEGNRGFLRVLAAQEQAADDAAKKGEKLTDEQLNQRALLILRENKLETARLQKLEDATGKPDPNAAAAASINQVNNFLKDVSSGFGAGLAKANTELGTFIQNVDGMQKLLAPRTREEAKKLVDLIVGGGLMGAVKPLERENPLIANPDQPAPKPKKEGKFVGDDVFANQIYRVGENGFEDFIPAVNGSIIRNDVLKSSTAELKSAMAEYGNAIKALSTLAKEPINLDVKAQAQEPKSVNQDQSVEILKAIADGINQLNTGNRENNQYLSDLVNSSSKTVRAISGAGNRLAHV